MDTTDNPVGAGVIIFGLLGIWGMRLLYRGFRGDILDSSGHKVAGRMWFIGGGLACVLAFVGFLVFVSRRGYFGHRP